MGSYFTKYEYPRQCKHSSIHKEWLTDKEELKEIDLQDRTRVVNSQGTLCIDFIRGNYIIDVIITLSNGNRKAEFGVIYRSTASSYALVIDRLMYCKECEDNNLFPIHYMSPSFTELNISLLPPLTDNERKEVLETIKIKTPIRLSNNISIFSFPILDVITVDRKIDKEYQTVSYSIKGSKNVNSMDKLDRILTQFGSKERDYNDVVESLLIV